MLMIRRSVHQAVVLLRDNEVIGCLYLTGITPESNNIDSRAEMMVWTPLNRQWQTKTLRLGAGIDFWGDNDKAIRLMEVKSKNVRFGFVLPRDIEIKRHELVTDTDRKEAGLR